MGKRGEIVNWSLNQHLWRACSGAGLRGDREGTIPLSLGPIGHVLCSKTVLTILYCIICAGGFHVGDCRACVLSKEPSSAQRYWEVGRGLKLLPKFILRKYHSLSQGGAPGSHSFGHGP